MKEKLLTYKTIAEPCTATYREKSSKFICKAFPCSNENQAKEILKTIKSEYFDATHHCYAYRLGFDYSLYRTNDDGEPSGTAGKPIYGQILSKNLTNILIIVIRYYGGTKLGASGLINAYKTSAQLALDEGIIVERKILDVVEISFDYADMETVMRAVKNDAIYITKQDFNLKCVLYANVERAYTNVLVEALKRFENILIVIS